jgi:hypothetical protein
MTRRQRIGHYGILLLLSILLPGLESCCCSGFAGSRGISITIEEAKEEMVFALYLPAYLPSYVDPKPQVFRLQDEPSLAPYAKIYYTRTGQDSERVFMILARFAGSTSITRYATGENRLVSLANGNLALDRSASFDNSGVQNGDLVKGPAYQTCLVWDVGRGEEKALYSIYSTLSLSETLAIVNSMEPVP